MKQQMSQIEKFNQRMGKSAADQESLDKVVEAGIVQRLEERKDMYKTIDLLAKSVTLISDQMDALSVENEQLKKVITQLSGQVQKSAQVRSEFDILADHFLDMHKQKMLVSRTEMSWLGLDAFALIQHKERNDQIRAQGFFVDAVDEEEEVAVAQEEVPLTVNTEAWTITWKKGKRPKAIVNSLAAIHSSMQGNKILWPKDDAALIVLIKHFLALAQYEGVNVSNTHALQKSRYARVAYQVSTRFGSYKQFIKEMF